MNQPLKRKPSNIYNPAFVKGLFNEMARTYGTVNLVSSFWFCQRWRSQCVNQIQFKDGMTVYDLMSGMGECWEHVDKRVDGKATLVAVDFCPAMCRRARKNVEHMRHLEVAVLEQDVLANTLPDASADCVVSTFGLKTFSDVQAQRLAAEINRLLKPHGAFSLLEISLPTRRLLRWSFGFYVKYVIPLIGKVFLGNPDNYRMLGIYTEKFKDCSRMARWLRNEGLEVDERSYFFGCATGVVGRKV